MGLIVLHPPSTAEAGNELTLDIVAIHGLNGHPIKSWTHPKNEKCWLEEFLPLDMPQARIMTFGYNADAAFGNTTAEVLDIAKDLLGSLIDKREEAGERERPLIFVAHSLGGIVVKQALMCALIEPQYHRIKTSTLGIVFFGTPHHGSEKASYGRILSSVATTMMRRPSSRFISALVTNSDYLVRLTGEFRHQLLNYKVATFYELKAMSIFSSPIVEKHSALLQVPGEDQVPVNANHSDICKFKTRDDETYEKFFKRIRRMMEPRDPESNVNNRSESKNKHYEVPRNVSSVFSGRRDVMQELSERLMPRAHQSHGLQKRFVLYGMGGSGKSQICLKFAQDYRERFWGIFWIDASSKENAEQGFVDITRACGSEMDFKMAKQWLSNLEDPWILIIDNADNPDEDVARYFPIGGRGAILLTTRNPDCKIHATVGDLEIGQMPSEDAITLLLKSSCADNVLQPASRELAKPVVEILGCLALAISQAGAVIRQKRCSIEEYPDLYSRSRKDLLSRQPVQASSDYKYTVFSTWELSIRFLESQATDAAQNALELLSIFAFWHFDGIPEDIFKRAWEKMQQMKWARAYLPRVLLEDCSKNWDPEPLREAVLSLTSFSLVSVDVNNRVSMHPLVHSWAKDRLPEDEKGKCSKKALLTLGLSIPWTESSLDFSFTRLALPHVEAAYGQSLHDLLEANAKSIGIAKNFALVYRRNGLYVRAGKLQELALEAEKRTLGEEHPYTFSSMNNLALIYSDVGRHEDALKLQKMVLEAMKRSLGEEHPNTLLSMNNLAISYSNVDRHEDALKLEEVVLEARKRTLGEEHLWTLSSMKNLATSYSGLGRHEAALKLREVVLEARKRTQGKEHPDTLSSMNNLAISYSAFHRNEDALKLEEVVLEARKRTLGEEHPQTFSCMNNLAVSYYDVGQEINARRLAEMALEGRKRVLGDEHPDTLQSARFLEWIDAKQVAQEGGDQSSTSGAGSSQPHQFKKWRLPSRRKAKESGKEPEGNEDLYRHGSA